MLTGTCHCGATGWTFAGMPESATACNCTLCRRYGTLWIYDYRDKLITISGPTRTYRRRDMTPEMDIHFCRDCAGVICWMAIQPNAEGFFRTAVNLRLSDPDPVAHLPIDHFEGLVSFDDLPRDGRTVADMWF